MATRAHHGGPSGLPSPALLETAIRRLSRNDLADLCEQLIDRLDALDPDPDLELNGDELDGTGAEDDFCDQNAPIHLQGPGCPLADPDLAADDIPCDEPTQDLEPEDLAEDFSDPEARSIQLKRIQQTRCYAKRSRWRNRYGEPEVIGHGLFYEPIVPTKRQLFRRKRGVPRRPRG